MKCETCDGVIGEAPGCVPRWYVFEQINLLPSIPMQFTDKDYDENMRCVECGVLAGHQHHTICALERCPQCGGYLISCPCSYQDA